MTLVCGTAVPDQPAAPAPHLPAWAGSRAVASPPLVSACSPPPSGRPCLHTSPSVVLSPSRSPVPLTSSLSAWIVGLNLSCRSVCFHRYPKLFEGRGSPRALRPHAVGLLSAREEGECFFFPAILLIRGGTFLRETLRWKLPHSWSLAAPVSHTRWTVMGLLPHLSLF